MPGGPSEAPRTQSLPDRVRHCRRGDPGWPDRLSDLVDPPAGFDYLGRLSLLAERCVAIVGSRAPSESGREIARRLGRDLAADGFVVVSGMARGVDAAAHRGALEVGGSSVAVLGTGVDHCYPASSRDVHARLARDGLLISELPLGAPPLRGHFPQRNRIIAALSEAVVVVEGGRRSGSRITADMALDLGREVLAVPRDPLAPNAETPNALIAAGATLVTCAGDVLFALGAGGSPAHPLTGSGAVVPPRLEWLASTLEASPLSVDELVRITGRTIVEVLPGLLDLELRGVAGRDEAGRYRRVLSD